jgi:flavin reductase (DIM6/NTAB) family NADH-FMN oxidoreductase RutF
MADSARRRSKVDGQDKQGNTGSPASVATRHGEPSGGSEPMEMELRTRQKALRMLASGVYVMTSRSAEDIGAATVTWVSQASFVPPLLMAAVRRQSSVFQYLAESGVAALHIVGEHQQDVAWRFLFPTSNERGRINGESFSSGKTAAPILSNLPAHIECELERIVETDGDHAVVILRVVDAECRDDDVRPLTMANSPWRYGV